MNTLEIICTIIGTAITVIGSTIGGVYYLLRKAEKKGVDTHRFDIIESRVNELPCEHHSKKINKAKRNLRTIIETTESTNDMVTSIAEWVIKQDKKMTPTLIGKRSPTVLTDTGIEFLSVSGGKDCVDNNMDFLLSEISKTNPLRPYDVEEKSRQILLSNTGRPIFNNIKDYIYYSPEKIDIKGVEVEISLFSIVLVMSIYLRDKYLALHPEMEEGKELELKH